MNPNGSGLGLTFAKQIAKIMGGDITCKSILGKGSIFTFRFEAQQVEVQKEQTKKKEKKQCTSSLLNEIKEDEHDLDVSIISPGKHKKRNNQLGAIIVADEVRMNFQAIKLNLESIGITSNVFYCSEGNLALKTAIKIVNEALQ